MRVEIPRTINAAGKRLAALDKVVMATEWERAAIVAAFVRDGRKAEHDSFMSATEFAELGIIGLASSKSVHRYVAMWDQTGRERPEPGRSVTLPSEPWPNEPRSPAQDLGDVKRAVMKHGLPTVMKAASEAYAETPEGKKMHQGVARVAKRREAEEAEAGVSDWGIVFQFLDGPAADLRDFAERCVEQGFTDDDARGMGALLAKHVRATADLIEAATEGATALTDDDLDLLRGGTV